MNFNCQVNQSLFVDPYDEDKGGVDLFLNFDLPFVPYPGICIETGIYFFEIDNVIWKTEIQKFICTINNTNDIFWNKAPSFDYEIRKEALIKNGWQKIFES